MPTPDTIQGVSLPTFGDAPAVPTHLADLYYANLSRAVPRFANNSARGTAYPSPAEGQMCYTADSDTLWIYVGSWLKVWSAADNQGWVNVTYPTSYATVGSFVGQSKLTRDGVFVRVRIVRTATTTGTVTWANMPTSSHWPVGVWELGGIWEPTQSTHIRAYVDTDGGIKTASTPSTMTQLYATSFFPRD